MSRSIILCRHGTYTDPRRVHYRQEHLFSAFMLQSAVIAQPSLIVKDALRADLGGRFTAFLARDHRWNIPGKHLDSIPPCCYLPF
jgi:hypothetical protein